MDTTFLVMAFVLGAGFGFLINEALNYIQQYLDKKHSEDVAEENWGGLALYLNHRMVRDNHTGKPVWVKDDREFEEDV